MKTSFPLLVSASAYLMFVSCASLNAATIFSITYADGSTSTAGAWQTADGQAVFSQPAANEVWGTANAEAAADSYAVSASAEAFAVFLGITSGPVRDGYALLTVHTDGDHSADPDNGWGAKVSMGGYSCEFADCFDRLTIPFELGVPFTVSMDVSASAYFLDMWGNSSAGGVGEIDLKVFDMTGAPVTVTDPMPTPEPVFGWGAGLIALAAIAGNRIRNGNSGS